MIARIDMRALTLLALLTPLPAAAQTFGLPQGCTAYVTIQSRGCMVSHLFTCATDPPGQQRRADLDESGVIYLGLIDAETQWLESAGPADGSTERLLPDPADPASLTNLLASGRDDFAFATRTDDAFDTVFRGHDALTGASVVIDGVTLLATTFDVTASDTGGGLLWRTTGAEYVHPEWRTFIAGTRTTTTPDDSFERDATPVAFIFPGEEGFLSSTPRHDCGVMMSKAAAFAAVDSGERN